MDIVKTLLSKGNLDLAITLGIVLAFLWVLSRIFVYVITKTHIRKMPGAEFDPENPATNRRRR